MKMRILTAAVGAAWLLAGAASAQQPAAPPNLDAIPDKMPWPRRPTARRSRAIGRKLPSLRPRRKPRSAAGP